MSLRPCHEIEPLLVDYADGDLPAEDSARVTEHVAGCDECRCTLAALRRSLELAGAVWQADEASLAGVRIPIAQRRRGTRRWMPALAAAAILLAVGVASLWWRRTPAEQPTAGPAGQTIAEQEETLNKVGAAAQLLAAADCLAEQPGGLEIAVERYRYIIATYPQTDAASAAAARVRAHQERRT